MTWDTKIPSLVTRSRLVHSAPDVVYSELKEYSAYHGGDAFSPDHKLEEALLLRNDPLINLALAQYGGSSKIAGVLYDRAVVGTGDSDFDKGLRLAVLGNPTLVRQDLMFRSNLFFGVLKEEDVLQIFTSDDEFDREALNVIVNNPGAKKLLGKLYRQEKPFDSVPETKFLQAVYRSHSNPAINSDDSNEHGPDMYAWDVQKGIRNLLAKLPPTEDGLLVAHAILSFINPRNIGSFDHDPTPIIERWLGVKLSDEFKKYPRGNCNDLQLNEELACLIASLYYYYHGPNNKSVYIGSADSSQKYLRCAHYAHERMTADQMQIAYNKDGDAFTLAALNNDQLFWQPGTRGKLEQLMRWRLIHRYQRRCEQIKAKSPRFDLAPVTEHGAALLEDRAPQPSEDQKRLAKLEQHMAVIAKALQSNSKVLSWLLILMIVAIVLIWRPYF